MGAGICCGEPEKTKQPQAIYKDSKATALTDIQNAKNTEELKNKEKQIAKLLKANQDLKMANQENSKKHSDKLKEQTKNYKMKEDKINQQYNESVRMLKGKLQMTEKQKQQLEIKKKIQQQEANRKLLELKQKYQNKIKTLEEQYQLKRTKSSILREQTQDRIQQLVSKHKVELQKLIEDNKKLQQNKKKQETQYLSKLISLQRQLEDTKQNNPQIINKQNQKPHQNHHIALFQNEIFESQGYSHHKQFLINSIQSRMNKMIIKTRLLFKLDLNNKTNFHTYIDNKPNIVVVIKLSNEYFVAGFSQVAFVPKSTARGEAMILSLTNQKVFYLFDADKKPISYDEYYLIFGNSQIRLRSQQKKIFSNFGVNNSSFNNKGLTVDILLGAGRQREVDIDYYEIYQVFFEE